MGQAISLKRITGQETISFVVNQRDGSNRKEVEAFDKRIAVSNDGSGYIQNGQVAPTLINGKRQPLLLELHPGDVIVKDSKNTLHLYTSLGFATQYQIQYKTEK